MKTNVVFVKNTNKYCFIWFIGWMCFQIHFEMWFLEQFYSKKFKIQKLAKKLFWKKIPNFCWTNEIPSRIYSIDWCVNTNFQITSWENFSSRDRQCSMYLYIMPCICYNTYCINGAPETFVYIDLRTSFDAIDDQSVRSGILLRLRGITSACDLNVRANEITQWNFTVYKFAYQSLIPFKSFYSIFRVNE